MGSTITILILCIIATAIIVSCIEFFRKKRIITAILRIIDWFNYVSQNADNTEEEKLSALIEHEIGKENIGGSVMFFSDKFKKSVAKEFSHNDTSTYEQEFRRLAQWEGNYVRLDVYWTMIHGDYAKYAEYRDRGENLDFSAVSNPVSILRKYWKV